MDDEAQDQRRALRLRDNKRRHRQRQKEYVADLEQRLAESRERGVQATKEVQSAARRVSWENRRLRQILHGHGLDDDAINSLIYCDARTCRVSPSPTSEGSRLMRDKDEVFENPCDGSAENLNHSPTRPSSSPLEPSVPQCASQTADTSKQASNNNASTPPCKLLTILAGNPHADITQMPATPDTQQEQSKKPGGIECLQAQKMLMRFATTEDKLDEIATALEEGCVEDGSGRGCQVRNEVVWKALDRFCD